MARVALSPAAVDDMRTRLCDEALTLFRQGGVDAVTFRTLADAMGVSHTLPYRYFRNKEALLAAVRVQCFAQFERHVRRHEASGSSAVGRVLAVLDGYVSFVLEHRVEYELLFATSQPPPQRFPALLAARVSLFEHSVGLVQDCIDAGALRGEARELTHVVWAALHGLLTLHVANQLVHGYRLRQLIAPLIQRTLGLSVSTEASAPNAGEQGHE